VVAGGAVLALALLPIEGFFWTASRFLTDPLPP
jgi:hypothetical protein